MKLITKKQYSKKSQSASQNTKRGRHCDGRLRYPDTSPRQFDYECSSSYAEGVKFSINAFKEIDNSVTTVVDTGVGIPAETKEKLITPLFTTKSKGQRFGLAVVKRMTESLVGTVTI